MMLRCAFALLLLSVTAHAEDISGTYVGRGVNSAFLVQIVQTSDGRLTGHYKQITLQGGKLTEMDASIAGASDGGTITFTLKPAEFLAGRLSLSGTIEGSMLHASGGGYGRTITLNLSKATEGAFQALVAGLSRHAELTNNRRTIKQALPRVELLTNRIAKFSRGLPAYLARFRPLEHRYRAITYEMRAGLARQRSIYCENPSGYCDGQATVARTQLAVRLQQAAIKANQLHLSVQSNYRGFVEKARASEKLIKDLIRSCQSASIEIDDQTLVERWQKACKGLIVAVPEYQGQLRKLRDAFAQAERVWKEQRPEQKGIVNAAFNTNERH